jgi:hypothetical protein
MVINYEPGCGGPHFGREPYDQRYEKFKVSNKGSPAMTSLHREARTSLQIVVQGVISLVLLQKPEGRLSGQITAAIS